MTEEMKKISVEINLPINILKLIAQKKGCWRETVPNLVTPAVTDENGSEITPAVYEDIPNPKPYTDDVSAFVIGIVNREVSAILMEDEEPERRRQKELREQEIGEMVDTATTVSIV